MAVYTGNVNRVTGLSGVDTESMIDKMMKAESVKYEKLQKEEISVGWKQEAYREIITAMQDFQNKWFSSTNPSNHIGFQSAWNNFTTTVKDSSGKESSAISIKGSVQTGKYEIEVTQVAQKESITGKPKVIGEITTGASLDEIYTSIEKSGEVNFKFDLDGKSKEITITADEMKNSNGATNAEKVKNIFTEKLNKEFGNKITVSEKNGKLVFSASSTSSLTISDGKDITKNTSVSHSGILDSSKEGKYELKVTIGNEEYTVNADFKSGDSADDRVNKVISAFKDATNSKGEKVDISKDISLKITKDGDNLKIENYSDKEEYKIEATFTDSTGASTTVNQELNSTSNLDKLGLTSGKVSTSVTENTSLSQALGDDFKKFFDANKNNDGVVVLNFGGKDITLTENDTIKTLCKKIESSESSVNLSFNQVTGRFKIESSESGADNTIDISNQTTKDFLLSLGIDIADKTKNDAYVKGQNAEVIIDGIKIERASNEVDMNGLKFEINGTTNGKVTIEAKSDNETTFNKLKEFVDDYNKLIESIESKVNQKREKSGEYGYYEPLLPDEKDAMKEDEIKKWEEKAKTGLLYNDDLLRGMLSTLRNIPYQKVNIGGVEISLSEIGISHGSNYNSGKLEIDETKLKKAIDERGDDIASMFTQAKTGIADQMKAVIDNAIGTKGSLRAKAGIKDTSSVNDNTLSKELKNIAKRLAAEKERLYNKEMYYFKMFSQMETAMNQQNSQMSMMLSLLGQ